MVVPCKARAVGLGGAAVWVPKRNPSKNREGGGVSALGGRRSIKTPNNQPKVGGSVRGDDRVEARWAESEGEGVGVSFGASI
jgi:hypothetical protein